MAESLLAGWDNFYVITGSAAAGLTGLTFVVIALASDSKRVNLRGLRAYVTPTIVHFGTVLALSAYLCMPHQSVLSLSAAFAITGFAGLAYVTVIGVNIGRVSSEYIPAHEDWIWNVVLPGIGYAALGGCAYVIWRRPEPCLYALGAVSLSLMFIGIHNAWDIAVWNSVRKPDDST